jgi:hypothetical protein
LVVLSLGVGCRSAGEPDQTLTPAWDLDRVEVFEWRADDPAFDQDFALEASGLAMLEGSLLVPSEKYGRILVIDPESNFAATVVPVGTPRHAELEGVAVAGDNLVLCDEAHAAVYEISAEAVVGFVEAPSSRTVEARQLTLEDVGVTGGKIGFEGIETNPRNNGIYLLLEREGNAETGCVSKIFSLRCGTDRLVSDAEPLVVELEDCYWRLTGLAWWGDRLIALKTQFPGERYEIVAVDLSSGESSVILEMTSVLRALGGDGWSNNVEGLAVADDGSLWMVADNAVTGVIDDPEPPRIGSRTLLVRIPRTKEQD